MPNLGSEPILICYQAAIGDPSLTLGWNDHNIYAGASIVSLSASDTLSSTSCVGQPDRRHGLNESPRRALKPKGAERRPRPQANSISFVATALPGLVDAPKTGTREMRNDFLE